MNFDPKSNFREWAWHKKSNLEIMLTNNEMWFTSKTGFSAQRQKMNDFFKQVGKWECEKGELVPSVRVISSVVHGWFHQVIFPCGEVTQMNKKVTGLPWICSLLLSALKMRCDQNDLRENSSAHFVYKCKALLYKWCKKTHPVFSRQLATWRFTFFPSVWSSLFLEMSWLQMHTEL